MRVTYRPFSAFRHILSILLLSCLMFLAIADNVAAQDTTGTPTPTPAATIEFNGPVTSISIDRLIINNLVVLVDVPNMLFVPQIGMVVYVQGNLQPDGTIVAVIVSNVPILLTSTPDPSETPVITATATPEGTPPATLTPTITPTDDLGLGPIIVIEGPVEAININIITIYNINIVVSEDDPILAAIRIGDFIRVEGELDDDDGDDDDDSPLIVGVDSTITVVIIAINITIVDIDVYINEGEVWRDDDDSCLNPPPPWAPAHGWRRRCENNNNNPGRGNPGRGDDDDDDD